MQTKKNFIPQELQSLISHLKKISGVGTKTAERFAFELMGWPQDELRQLGELLQALQEKVPSCPTCGCLSDRDQGCPFCASSRDHSLLCIVASPRDAYAIEETHAYRGLYHVVEHLLSPLDGKHIASLGLERIEQRMIAMPIKEIVIAFDSTLEGDTTALYLKKHLTRFGVPLTRLAFGMPIGSALEYIDTGTLSRSLMGRQSF